MLGTKENLGFRKGKSWIFESRAFLHYQFQNKASLEQKSHCLINA